MAVGRPRAFDTDEVLDRALKVFWRKGYEGTTLPDLTRAMGINRPSLYAAFGNKEALFRKVLDRYAVGPAACVHAALEEPTARRVAERLLLDAVDLVTNPKHPGGCLAVHGALACGDEAQVIRQELITRRATRETAIRRRLQRARAAGDLPAAASPADLARFLTTMIQGIAVQAASGASRAELRRVAKTALRAWPSKT
jgi:AcrR family transcriptional regulator